MRTTVSVSLLALAGIFSGASAAPPERQPGQIVASPASGGTARGATFDPPFNDPGNGQAKELAAREGISVGEATRHLRLMHKAGQLARRLERQSSDSFAGIEVVETSAAIQFKAHFVGGDKPENQSLLAKGAPDAELQGTITLAESAFSHSGLLTAGDRLIAEVKSANLDSAVAINPFDGVVRFLAKDPAAVRAAIEQGRIKPPPGYVVEQSSGIVLTTALIGGAVYNAQYGTYAECTMGFSVLQSGATRGATTAGHCDINSPAQYNGTFASHYGDAGGVTLTFKQEWITNNLDVQWHTAASPNTIEPQFWNGASAITVTGAAQSLTGETLCKFGRTTGQTCGKVDANWTWDPNFSGYYLRMNTATSGTFLTLEGDSGGPVYSGSIAKGWIHGRDGTGNAYFMPVTEFYNKVPSMQVLCVC